MGKRTISELILRGVGYTSLIAGIALLIIFQGRTLNESVLEHSGSGETIGMLVALGHYALLAIGGLTILSELALIFRKKTKARSVAKSRPRKRREVQVLFEERGTEIGVVCGALGFCFIVLGVLISIFLMTFDGYSPEAKSHEYGSNKIYIGNICRNIFFGLGVVLVIAERVLKSSDSGK